MSDRVPADPLSDDDVQFFTESLVDTPVWQVAAAIQKMAMELRALRAVYRASCAYERAFVDEGCREDECSEFARNLVYAVRNARES